MTRTAKSVLFLALVCLSKQAPPFPTTDQVDKPFELLDGLLLVGQLNQSMFFLATDFLVYEFHLTGLDVRTNRLNMVSVKPDRFQDKWPKLDYWVRFGNEALPNAITLRDSDNSTYLFAAIRESPNETAYGAFYNFDNNLPTIATFTSPEPLDSNVWISSFDAKVFYILKTTDIYSMAKYRFETATSLNESTNATKLTEYLTFCTDHDVTDIILTKDSCIDQFNLSVVDWSVSRGSVFNDHFYLFGDQLVYSFETSALDNLERPVKLYKTALEDFVCETTEQCEWQTATTTTPNSSQRMTTMVYNHVTEYRWPHPNVWGVIHLCIWFGGIVGIIVHCQRPFRFFIYDLITCGNMGYQRRVFPAKKEKVDPEDGPVPVEDTNTGNIASSLAQSKNQDDSSNVTSANPNKPSVTLRSTIPAKGQPAPTIPSTSLPHPKEQESRRGKVINEIRSKLQANSKRSV